MFLVYYLCIVVNRKTWSIKLYDISSTVHWSQIGHYYFSNNNISSIIPLYFNSNKKYNNGNFDFYFIL